MSKTERRALLIATSEYKHPALRGLASPNHDAIALRRVLANPAIGGFAVTLLSNRGAESVRRTIEQFFTERLPGETAVCYFSGHGLKDDDGNLYIAARDTIPSLLRSTAIQDGFLRDAMRSSRAKSQVLILDCCFGGAFSRAMLAKSAPQVDVNDRFQGTGRVVMTASTAMEFAYEGDQITGQASLSVFTRTLVKGLSSGEADVDGDGLVSVQDLYQYAYREIVVPGSHQTPTISAVGQEGSIYLASSSWHPAVPRRPATYDADSIDLRPYAGIATANSDYVAPVVVMETSLAFQGRRVALDRDDFSSSLLARARHAGEDSISYLHSDLIDLLQKTGVASDPPGRHFRAKAIPVRTSEEAITQLRLGRPILAGTMIRDFWLSPEVAASGLIPVGSGKGSVLGGRTIAIMGYDAREDSYIILTGWPSWGVRGFGTLPKIDAFGRAVHDAHAIEAYEGSAESVPEPGVPDSKVGGISPSQVQDNVRRVDLPAGMDSTLADRIRDGLGKFHEYLTAMGLLGPEEREPPVISLSSTFTGSLYHPDLHRIEISPDLISNPHVVFREYCNYALSPDEISVEFSVAAYDLKSGLSFYFPCSFTGEPTGFDLFGVSLQETGRMVKRRGTPSPANQRRAYIWASIFWEMRQVLGGPVQDQLAAAGWLATVRAASDGNLLLVQSPQATYHAAEEYFVGCLLDLLPGDLPASESQSVREVLTRRRVLTSAGT